MSVTTTAVPRGWAVPDHVRFVREPGRYPAPRRLRSPEDALRVFSFLATCETEEFWVALLDTQCRVIGLHQVSVGTVNSSLVRPRETFRAAIVAGASAIVVAHNHPSGDVTPSPEDQSITRQLAEAGRLLDIPIMDHVIISGDGSHGLSFAGSGLL